ncbi:MAG: hypothetical protein DMG05_23710, partial [Acidobacteria bacterium]
MDTLRALVLRPAVVAGLALLFEFNNWRYVMKKRSSRLIAVLCAGVLVMVLSPSAFAQGVGAPVGATYITQTPNDHLSSNQSLSPLATGLLKNTTGTGVLTIATPGVDYVSAAQLQALINTVNALQGMVTTLQGQVATLQSQQATTNNTINSLLSQLATAQTNITTIQNSPAQALNECVSVSHDTLNGLIGPHVLFTGCNVHVRSGSGRTEDEIFTVGQPRGLGNLIVGYNEVVDELITIDLQPGDRGGSHNIVLGPLHRFRGIAGLVAGLANNNFGVHSSITGGKFNTVRSGFDSISGGSFNETSGLFTSISGGANNRATSTGAHVSGGSENTASANMASVSGGSQNTASGATSSVSGGSQNTASRFASSVSGGNGNTASGENASVSGGVQNSALVLNSSISGGNGNRA